ncbi:MAG: 2-hydroxymuconate-semialdehyde hydrolase [Chloroflexota bacterium]|jgi:2-hydroxy-6-oxonona-2,4-dienedioate hydrolase|nr:2-hydroxymuconate-semialdehyde hydrolase [Chloroflexota bacterium]
MITAERGTSVEVAGVDTFYIQKGAGPALVMIHGGAPGACARVNWGANIDFFAENGFTVYAFDQPGYGRSGDPPQADYSMEFRVTHAKAFIDQLGLGEFDLVGNSQGSYIVARLALEDPRVRRLVLVSSGTLAPRGDAESDRISREHAERLAEYEPSLENCWSLTRQTLFNQERVTEDLVRERYAMSTGRNHEVQAQRRAAPTPRPITGELKNLTVPTLLMWGANDSGVALERSLLLFKMIPGAELHIFDRCAHWVQWDQAERFNAIALGFLHSHSWVSSQG